MTVVMPETQKSRGFASLVVLSTAPANPAAPTIAELSAGVPVQCHIYGDFQPEVTQNVGEGPRKMCSAAVPEQFGDSKTALSDVQYSYIPQGMATPGTDGNEAVEALVEGTNKWLYERLGINGKKATFDEDEVLTGYPVVCGKQRRGRTGDGEFDEFAVTQSFVMANGAEPVYDAVVVGP